MNVSPYVMMKHFGDVEDADEQRPQYKVGESRLVSTLIDDTRSYAPFTMSGRSPVARINKQCSARHESVHTIRTWANLPKRPGFPATYVRARDGCSPGQLSSGQQETIAAFTRPGRSVVLLLFLVLLNIHMCLNMLKDDEIEAEIIIHLVQDKPQIWDKSLQDDKNRNMTRDAWIRVSVELKEEFESLNDGKRK
ncbi:hypothetical protein PR048_012593 [Dryococelus australis]|uniref:MADF domain-containing protein n=1 Tax=Dryococelus australis TaxID=614101 RepID=A0ABQ9HPS5_9NEOP|nr:hypothetical protein PR048_012593 [Dryococelus australis]